MSGFDDRRKGEEARLGLDDALRFKAEARRNRILADWAAGLMGLEGEEALAYRGVVQAADFEEAGDEDVFRRLRADLDAKGVEISDHRVRRRMEEAMAEALEELRGA